MDLNPLMALVGANPSDPEAWAVLGDALHDTGTELGRADAITAELQGAPPAPVEGAGPSVEGLLVSWRYGYWHTAWLRGTTIGLHETLLHPSAPFLRRLIVALDRIVSVPAEMVPATLRHVEIEDLSQTPSNAPVDRGFLDHCIDQLLTLKAPLCTVQGPLRARQLRRLHIGNIALKDPELPALRHLTLPFAALGQLCEIGADRLPVLRTLHLEGAGNVVELDEFLQSVVGQGIRQLALERNPSNVAWATTRLSEHRHLETVVLDVAPNDTDRLGTRVRPRTSEQGSVRDPIVRLVAPAQTMDVSDAMEEACEQLGIGLNLRPDYPWVRVPEVAARRIAHRMAALSGFAAEVITATEFIEFGSGRAEAMEVSAGGYLIDPTGFTSPPKDAVARRTASFESDDPGVDVRNYAHSLFQELWEDLDIAEDIELQIPVRWQPDPFALEGPPPWGPRLVSKGGSDDMDLNATLAGYVAWRVRAAGCLEHHEAPDLRRWTTRLLRRYRLRRPPETQHDHPFWAEWERLTRAERALRAGEPLIPSFKFLAPGRWIVDGREAQLIANALGGPMHAHRCPAECIDGLAALRAFMDHTSEIHIHVGPTEQTRAE